MNTNKKRAKEYLENSTNTLLKMFANPDIKRLDEINKRALESLNKQIKILKRLDNA